MIRAAAKESENLQEQKNDYNKLLKKIIS